MPRKKLVRDISQLSGKPLSETLEPSHLNIDSVSHEKWFTSPDLREGSLPFSTKVVYSMMLFLLANPNMNSSHLYRADILYDSWGVMWTPWEKEKWFDSTLTEDSGNAPAPAAASASESESQSQYQANLGREVNPLPAKDVPGFRLTRTLVRRLIPRNPKLDRPMDQTAYFYEKEDGQISSLEHDGDTSGLEEISESLLVIYTPHVQSKEDMPWYHPLLQSLAFLYEFKLDSKNGTATVAAQDSTPSGTGTMSLHFLPYEMEPISKRLERTLLVLLNSQIRLARGTRDTNMPDGSNYNPSKDNVLPQHLVQNTYSRLKLKYAADLCQRWVEDTPASKHVFEDLSITAFLIELWRMMYGVVPSSERDEKNGTTSSSDDDRTFPGFVDVACGNGVLVYVLLMEGYHGWGFDARCRKTWSIFPESVQKCLKESIYVPSPFADTMIDSEEGGDIMPDLGVEIHTGAFQKGTFIISNHADELTVWTPLMAALASPESPLPFLAIPCCSHSLSGARYRYPPPKPKTPDTGSDSTDDQTEESQPAKGDLKALRAEKLAQSTPDSGMDHNVSMYGCLTSKTMAIAKEVGYEAEKTLLRIPSTRNIGIVGGRRKVARECRRSRKLETPAQVPTEKTEILLSARDDDDAGIGIIDKVENIVSRECAREGGVNQAARIWIERARSIHRGPGKGAQRETGSEGHGHSNQIER